MRKKKKSENSNEFGGIQVKIFAICDLKTKVPIKVSLDFEELDFEFDLEDYDEKKYSIMSFDVILV